MRRFRAVARLLATIALAGCEDPRAARIAAMNQLVGQPEQVLLLRMGVPTRSYDAEGVKYLAYDERRIDVVPGTPGIGFWHFGAMPPQPIERWCETTFQVIQGIVRSYALRGNACG